MRALGPAVCVHEESFSELSTRPERHEKAVVLRAAEAGRCAASEYS